MRYLVVSDIHGCLPRLCEVLRFFEENKYDTLVTLGDILNYGPRNGLPEGLDAMGIVDRLNPLKDRIIAVRGNCDSEVDQMLLDFPCMADYKEIEVKGKKIYLTHGHLRGWDEIPEDYAAYFSGHTHVWQLERKPEGTLVLNTGSITFPKEGREPSFATIEEDGTVNLRRLDGTVIKSESI